MKNNDFGKKDDLIPLLIKYVKVNKVIFPIERVKYLSNEEVIEILKDCIDNQVIYNPDYEMVKNITLLEDKDLKEIYPLIKESMDYINYDYMRDIKDLVNKLRKIHCTNPMINNQMKALLKNIMVLERIEKDYGSLDKFVKKETPNDIANMFNSGKYKLIKVGRAFAYDYLKRVGVNTCKKVLN